MAATKKTKKKTSSRIKQFPKGSFKLPIQTVTFVPSTEFDKRIPMSKFKKRADETRIFLAKLFGGFTSVRGKGGYVMHNKQLVKEYVMQVVAYSTKDSFAAKRAKWFAFLKKKKKEWKQEAIGVIIENDMAYI